MQQLKFWWLLTLLSMVGLVLLSVLWNGWFTPVQQVPRSIEIALLTVPLLLYLRSILNARRQSFIIVSLLSFLYVLVGVWFVYSPQESLYGYLMTVLAVGLFFGGFLYVRTLDKQEKEKNISVPAEKNEN